MVNTFDKLFTEHPSYGLYSGINDRLLPIMKWVFEIDELLGTDRYRIHWWAKDDRWLEKPVPEMVYSLRTGVFEVDFGETTNVAAYTVFEERTANLFGINKKGVVDKQIVIKKDNHKELNNYMNVIEGDPIYSGVIANRNVKNTISPVSVVYNTYDLTSDPCYDDLSKVQKKEILSRGNILYKCLGNKRIKAVTYTQVLEGEIIAQLREIKEVELVMFDGTELKEIDEKLYKLEHTMKQAKVWHALGTDIEGYVKHIMDLFEKE